MTELSLFILGLKFSLSLRKVMSSMSKNVFIPKSNEVGVVALEEIEGIPSKTTTLSAR